MTTHFKNGVTNVVGRDGGSSVFSGIKQPLITGGYEQEQAYQNDWQLFNDEDWTITSTGGSDFQLAEYAGGWLRHCLLYTSPSPRDRQKSRMPSSA